MVRPEIQAEVDRVIAGFRQECQQVLEETARLQSSLPEPPEGWREYFTRRIYTALLKYKEDVEAMVEVHLNGGRKGRAT